MPIAIPAASELSPQHKPAAKWEKPEYDEYLVAPSSAGYVIPPERITATILYYKININEKKKKRKEKKRKRG